LHVTWHLKRTIHIFELVTTAWVLLQLLTIMTSRYGILISQFLRLFIV
jgi:hypothetical protein